MSPSSGFTLFNNINPILFTFTCTYTPNSSHTTWLPQLVMRSSSIAPNPVEFREAPPNSTVPLTSQRHPEIQNQWEDFSSVQFVLLAVSNSL